MSEDAEYAGPDYLKEIEDLTMLVESGHDLVRDGNQVDLTNLEEPIADLCRRLAEAPPKDPDAVTVAIQHLVGRLGALSDALQAQVGNQN
jgi:hypothetical protein